MLRIPRKDIPCKVTPDKPELGFDLKFHTHFEISIPMGELHRRRRYTNDPIPCHACNQS